MTSQVVAVVGAEAVLAVDKPIKHSALNNKTSATARGIFPFAGIFAANHALSEIIRHEDIRLCDKLTVDSCLIL